MKRCLACGVVFPPERSCCPGCCTEPDKIDGFPAYAPELARGSVGFKANYFADLARLEAGNFWFQSRNQLITWALEKYCSHFCSFLEIGCGTGYVLSGIASEFPASKLYGSEIFVAGLAFAAARYPAADFMQMDARNIPFVNEFDAIGAFDVLEHIEEDDQVMTQVRAALKPEGVILLTIPQHPWLWSQIDEYACHVRRYTAKEIHEKIKKAGFQILRSTSFVTSLLPAMFVSRTMQKQTPVKDRMDATAELRIAPWLNYLFTKLLAAEIAMIRSGVNFPVGGSRLIVARKLV
jgi:SAM-dependent methyltransferase